MLRIGLDVDNFSMESITGDSVAKTGLLLALGGGLMRALDFLIRFLKLKKEEKIETIDADLRVSDSMLKYSNDLRQDIKALKEELKVLKSENEKLSDIIMELRESIKDMYLHNLDLKKKSDEFQKHLTECVMKVAGI